VLDVAPVKEQLLCEPAATLWTGAKRDGDFTVVVADRFVAKIEGTPADSLDALRTAMDQIDFK
jgi:hypothetical protein